MNEKPKETRARVYLRRAVLAALDAAIVAFSFYFALLLRADGAVEAAWWPHNLAILYHNLPWIVAVYVASFLLGGLYSVLWKYAGERDLLRLAVIVAVPTGIVYVVNRRCIHGVLFNSANCMAAVLILLLVGGSRLAWRLFLNHPLGERLRGVADLPGVGDHVVAVFADDIAAAEKHECRAEDEEAEHDHGGGRGEVFEINTLHLRLFRFELIAHAPDGLERPLVGHALELFAQTWPRGGTAAPSPWAACRSFCRRRSAHRSRG